MTQVKEPSPPSFTKRAVTILGLIIAVIVVIMVAMFALGIMPKTAAPAKEDKPTLKFVRTEKGCLEGKQVVRAYTNNGNFMLWNIDMNGRPILCGGEPLDLRQKGQE